MLLVRKLLNNPFGNKFFGDRFLSRRFFLAPTFQSRDMQSGDFLRILAAIDINAITIPSPAVYFSVVAHGITLGEFQAVAFH